MSSASHEILHIMWNPKLDDCGHKRPPLMPIMSQVNSSTPSQFVSLRSILLLSSHPWDFSLRFPHQNLAYISLLPIMCHMPHSPHIPRFYHRNNIWCKVQFIKILIMQSPQPPIHSLLLVPNIIPSTLFSDTFSFHERSCSTPMQNSRHNNRRIIFKLII